MIFQSNPGLRSDIDYFQKLADGAPVMIWMSGCDMGCFYFNKAWLDFRGRTAAQEYGYGWAEGVHPDDLERCVQHYVSSFQHRAPFAMSYRLLHHSGEYKWILDRGAPHYSAKGEFIGFYGGCAEMCADATVARVTELRLALNEMRSFAERIATAEAKAGSNLLLNAEMLRAKPQPSSPEECIKQHAAEQIRKLATDMSQYAHIATGICA